MKIQLLKDNLKIISNGYAVMKKIKEKLIYKGNFVKGKMEGEGEIFYED